MTPRQKKTEKEGKQKTFPWNGGEYIKSTFYLSHSNMIALEKIKTKLYEEKGERIDKSALVRRAIELMAKQEGII